MDDAFHRSNATKPGQRKRLFPSCTLEYLEAYVAKWDGHTKSERDWADSSPLTSTIDAMKSEIAARKDGRSVVRKTPQVGW